jgi:hypothetical protein
MSVLLLNRGDLAVESGSQVENTDALAATGGRNMDPQGGTAHPGYPPGTSGPARGAPGIEPRISL